MFLYNRPSLPLHPAASGFQTQEWQRCHFQTTRRSVLLQHCTHLYFQSPALSRCYLWCHTAVTFIIFSWFNCRSGFITRVYECIKSVTRGFAKRILHADHELVVQHEWMYWDFNRQRKQSKNLSSSTNIVLSNPQKVQSDLVTDEFNYVSFKGFSSFSEVLIPWTCVWRTSKTHSYILLYFVCFCCTGRPAFFLGQQPYSPPIYRALTTAFLL